MHSWLNIHSTKHSETNCPDWDKSVALYYIVLKKDACEPNEICICDLIGNVKGAKNETHNIWFYKNSGINEGVFVALLFAADAETALKKAINQREEAISKGEWQQAWERHQALHINVRQKL